MKLHHLLHEYFMQSQLQSFRLAEPGAGAGPCCPLPRAGGDRDTQAGLCPAPSLASRSRSCWVSRGCCCRVLPPWHRGRPGCAGTAGRGQEPALLPGSCPLAGFGGRRCQDSPEKWSFPTPAACPALSLMPVGSCPRPVELPLGIPGGCSGPPASPGMKTLNVAAAASGPRSSSPSTAPPRGRPPCPPSSLWDRGGPVLGRKRDLLPAPARPWGEQGWSLLGLGASLQRAPRPPPHRSPGLWLLPAWGRCCLVWMAQLFG